MEPCVNITDGLEDEDLFNHMHWPRDLDLDIDGLLEDLTDADVLGQGVGQDILSQHTPAHPTPPNTTQVHHTQPHTTSTNPQQTPAHPIPSHTKPTHTSLLGHTTPTHASTPTHPTHSHPIPARSTSRSTPTHASSPPHSLSSSFTSSSGKFVNTTRLQNTVDDGVGSHGAVSSSNSSTGVRQVAHITPRIEPASQVTVTTGLVREAPQLQHLLLQQQQVNVQQTPSLTPLQQQNMPVQTTVQQVAALPQQLSKRVVTTTVSQVVQQPPVVQQFVLPKTETNTSSAGTCITVPHTLVYKASPIATLTTPLAGLDTATVVTGIPVVLDGDRLPLARVVNQSIKPVIVPQKGERRNSHNAIEKRYRLSINDKITELKNLVADESTKMHKSQILKKAIELIHRLKNQNQRLRAELNKYRMNNENQKISDLLSPYTPPPSDGSPVRSPFSDTSPPVSPNAGKMEIQEEELASAGNSPSYQQALYRSIGEGSRMTLFVFLLTVLAFNPLGLFARRAMPSFASPASEVPGRTILEDATEGNGMFSLRQVMCSSALVWLVNLVTVAVVLVRVFVYGEPVLMKDVTSDSFWRHRKQADLDMAKGSYHHASHQYCLALAAVGRPLPGSFVEKVIGVMWQWTRQVLQRLHVGTWLAKYAGGLFLHQSVRDEVCEGVSECARVYHRLHQLHLMGHTQDTSHLLGLYLALTSINLAESGSLPGSTMAEMLVCCALRVKESLPERCRWLARLLLSRSERIRVKMEQTGTVSNSIKWLFTPSGRRFFVSQKWSYDANRKSMFTQFTDKADALAYLLLLYREHLIERAISTLVNPGEKAEDGDEIGRRTKTSDVLEYIRLLNDTYPPSSTLSFATRDEVCSWWGSLFGVVAHWLLSEDEQAEALYPTLENVPEALKTSEDPLPAAVLSAIKARRQLGHSSPSSVLRLCDRAGAALSESIQQAAYREPLSMVQSVQLLVVDLVLGVRSVLWENEREGGPDSNVVRVAHPEVLKGFRHDLALLRRLLHHCPGVLARVFLHGATLRMMAGASPTRTQQLLDRSLRHRSSRPSVICGKDKKIEHFIGDREHASALMLACRHLPTPLLSSPGERVGMLDEAAKTLEKIGDKRRLQDCYTLMKTLSNGVSTYC